MIYSEKLKDPRWQKKRLEVLERDGWKCQICMDAKSTLNVHHFKYHRQPWDTPAESLITLCERCHEKIEQTKEALLSGLADPLQRDNLEAITFLQKSISANNRDDLVSLERILYTLGDPVFFHAVKTIVDWDWKSTADAFGAGRRYGDTHSDAK